MKARQSLAKQLLIWGLTLFGITSVGIGYLWFNDLTSDDLSLGVILIAYSPSLAALIAAAVTRSSRDLMKQFLHWRVAPRFYLVAVGIAIVATGGAFALSYLFGPSPTFDIAGIGIGMGAIIAGSIGEELGWRGYLQPRLMRKFNLFWASILVGVLWSTWHCWTILAPHGVTGDWVVDAMLTYVRLVPTALLYGWLYSVSKRSLPVIMVAHAAHNIAINALIIPVTAHGFTVALAIAYCVLAALLVLLRPGDFFANTPSSTIDRK